MQEVLRGNMENLLLKVAPKEEIDKKLKHVFETLFGQNSPERIYFEEGDMAYIVDTGNDDDCFAVGQTRNVFSVMEVGKNLYDST